MTEKINFVTIELSKNQVDMKNPVWNKKTQKDYLRIFAPEGGVIFYPAKSLKIDKNDSNKVYFTRPEGTMLQVQYSKRKEGVADTAPDNEKYENTTKSILIEDLKEMFEESRRNFMENNGFVNMLVPTEWGNSFQNDSNQRFVSISIPIRENEEDIYYSFIIHEENFKESEKVKGMSYFGFPKKYKGSKEEPIEPIDYMVTLKTSVKQKDGTYKDEFKEMSSIELKKHVDAAVERSKSKDLFFHVEISEKLVRHFDSKDNKKLVAVSVPVYENPTDEKAAFYEIVLPAIRVKNSDRDGVVVVSMFKNGPDGTPYDFVGKKSVPKADGSGYENVTKQMTSEEVQKYFEFSAEKFKEKQQSADRSLADELETPIKRHGR